MRDRLSVAETITAVGTTLLAIWLHWIAFTAADGLWRDEANTVGLATLPHISSIWQNLQYDSFPMLWLLLVRLYATVFGELNDPAFRAIGFLTGLSIIAALWLIARELGHRLPLVSLPLLALTPALIKYGDSLRGYGSGIAAILFTLVACWRLTKHSSTRRFVIAAVCSVISVQLLYYNAVLLLTICAGCIAVAGRQRRWVVCIQILTVGIIAAITLIPYVTVIRAATSWVPLVQVPEYSFQWFSLRLRSTLEAASKWSPVIWFATVALCLFIALRRVSSTRGASSRIDDPLLFSLVTLVCGAGASYAFLKVLSYYTQPWYYLTLLCIVGVSLDIAFGSLVRSGPARLTRLAGAVAVSLIVVASALQFLRERMTNADTVASQLTTITRPGDLIVVTPWNFSISVARYYRGKSEMVTIPATQSRRFHRYDAIRAAMTERDQLNPIREAEDLTARVLKSGGTVFIAGDPSFPSLSAEVSMPSAAPTATGQWHESRHQAAWNDAYGQFVRKHARSLEVIHRPSSIRISHYERLTLVRAEGWID